MGKKLGMYRSYVVYVVYLGLNEWKNHNTPFFDGNTI
jgi:hypothetical protein